MSRRYDYAPFDGDGRARCMPTIVLPNTQGTPVSQTQARDTITRFMESGQSNHSARAGTLWVLLLWCQRHNVPYKLTAMPGLGYTIEKFETNL